MTLGPDPSLRGGGTLVTIIDQHAEHIVSVGSAVIGSSFRREPPGLDTQGHLNWAEYLHYAEKARWEYLAAAGITQDALLASGIGPAALDAHIAFKHELRGGD